MRPRPSQLNFKRRFQFSEHTVLLAVALAVGLTTGFCVWIFRVSFHYFGELFGNELAGNILAKMLTDIGIDPRFSIAIMLGAVGLLIGLISDRFVGHEKYHGVAGIMESVALSGGRLKYAKTPFKALAAALSLGAGASVGPEDPSVQIGANLGSFFGQFLLLSEERVKLLVSAGSASAIAAAFNAPIAGVFFALEVILGEFSTRSFSLVVLSSVISSAFMAAVGSGNPIFGDLPYVIGTPSQLPYYAVLGVLLGIFSAFAIHYFHWQEENWHKLIKLSPPLRTALTGVFVGLIGAFVFPQIMGTGEEYMHSVLKGEANLTVQFLLVLGMAKFAMTAISIGGGFVGGVFAPVLFVGISFGSAFGQIAGRFADIQTIGNPQAYAIAGMAGLMAGIVRAPITAILLIFELTDDYQLILPIMLTSVICVFFVERFGPAGIYSVTLMRNGIHLQQGRDIDVMQGITVGEAMITPAPVIEDTASLKELRDALKFKHIRALAVVDEHGHFLGIVTLSDLQHAFDRAVVEPDLDLSTLTVHDIYIKECITTSPDEVLWSAIRTMGREDIGHIPVIKHGTRALVGMLRRHDIMDAYNVAIMKKFHDQTTATKVRLETLTGAQVVEYHLPKDSPALNKQIRDLQIPQQTVIASIQRHHKLIVPRGNSELHKGDVITVIADEAFIPQLNALFGTVGMHPV